MWGFVRRNLGMIAGRVQDTSVGVEDDDDTIWGRADGNIDMAAIKPQHPTWLDTIFAFALLKLLDVVSHQFLVDKRVSEGNHPPCLTPRRWTTR
jgi:hypothetical protein